VNNVNHINAECTDLEVGQVLCIGTQGHDCQTTHVVGAGDSCDAIDSAAGVNMTLLIANNPQINEQCSNIYIGEVRSSCGS
jgi:LysM domain